MLNAANEVEGFVFDGVDAEQHCSYKTRQVSITSTPAGTIIRCPAIRCDCFIDTVAEVQRAMGFENEKDHPEVAPSQFEINYTATVK